MPTPRILSLLAMAAFVATIAPSALAAGATAGDSVNLSPHRVSLELGGVKLAKDERGGYGFGLGYAYHVTRGLELGLGARFVQITSHAISEGSSVEPAYHQWLLAASVRGAVQLDSVDRFEIGFTGRVGALIESTKNGVCCSELSFAPDLRVRIARSTALQLSPEIAVGGTGEKNRPNTEDNLDELFLQGALWLSVVQTP